MHQRRARALVRASPQHEAARERRRVLAAEDAAAQAAVRQELLATRLGLEEQLARVDGERRLRALAEQEALATLEVERQEAGAMEAAALADQQALALQVCVCVCAAVRDVRTVGTGSSGGGL